MGLRRYLRRAHWDRERLAEIESYIQIETDEKIALGMTPAEAGAAARRKFGNPTLVREEIFNMNTITSLDDLVRDVRYALRALRHNPTFTLVALLTLAIGIGANTAVFSVVNRVLIQPLPYPDAGQLVALSHKAPGAQGLPGLAGELPLSASMYVTYTEQNRTLQSLGVWATGTENVTGKGEPEQVRTVYLSGGVLQALGEPPLSGRWLAREDEKPGTTTVMLTYGYWQRRFGGDASIIGRKITVNMRPREIVGVMPRNFRFLDTNAELLMPLTFDRSKLMLPGFGLQCIARLKPGVTLGDAAADLARLVPVWMNSWPMVSGVDPHIYENWRITPTVRSLKDEVLGNVANTLWVLMGTIGIVMMIASANVANLLLVRAEARQRELAIRSALGAARGRIVREMLIESTLLGFLGGLLGLILAHAGVQLLVRRAPANLPRLGEISIDPLALVFTLLVSVVSGLLFGLVPALKYAGPRIAQALHSGGRSASHSRERHRARNVLVVAQVAMSLVLLVSAGLMIRTLRALSAVEPGFTQPENLQTVQTFIPGALIKEDERVIRTQNDIADKLAAIPEVSSVAFGSELTLQGGNGDWDVICSEHQPLDPAAIPPARLFKYVSPAWFTTMGTRLVAGREYTWTDIYERRPFAVISQNLAREMFGGAAAAVGKRISTCLPKAPLREVIGVVQDIRENGVQEAAPAIVYWPVFGNNIYPKDLGGNFRLSRGATFIIRSPRAGSEKLLSQLNQAVWSVNASLPLASVRTMGDIYNRSVARSSFTMVMLSTASAMALTLGIIGIYGVISYAVSQRRREIGIRLALGAQQQELRLMFLRSGLVLAGIGVVLGLGAAAGLAQLMRTLLFGVSPLDPLTYVLVSVVLIAAAVLASYLPARRAAAVDPVEALKVE